MPHLPATWRERQEADQERKAERVLHDPRFHRVRTRTARRALTVVTALLCAAILPAFVLAGGTLGILTTAAAAAGWGLLRLSIRTVADLPDRFLDERQQALRNRAYVSSYRILGSIVGGLATIGLIAFVIVSENDSATVTTTWDQGIGAVLSLTLLISLLPTMVIAWCDPGEQLADLAA